jgi:hypothetical protein
MPSNLPPAGQQQQAGVSLSPEPLIARREWVSLRLRLELKPPPAVRLQPARATPPPPIAQLQQSQPQRKHPPLVHLQPMRVTKQHPPAAPMRDQYQSWFYPFVLELVKTSSRICERPARRRSCAYRAGLCEMVEIEETELGGNGAGRQR